MIKKAIIFLTIFVVALNAVLYEPSIETKKDIDVLKNLDIDESFLKDGRYLKLRNNYNKYRSTLFLQILSDAYIYFPLIKQMLLEAGLPEELVYMAMAESNFKLKAYSKRRASGMWQFMPKTAQMYGLTVNNYIDERKDPIKSTKAAIKYLTDLHNRFGKWYLAILAYNCGGGRVNQAIRKVGSDSLSALLQTKRRTRRQPLPRESRGYIRKIIAMASIAQSESLMHATNHLHLLNRGITYPMVSIEVPAGTTLKEIASSIGMKHNELKKLNPFLRYDFTPPYGKKYQLYIPYDRLLSFKQNYKPSNKKQKFIVHIVKSGDTLGAIGRKYKIPYAVIKDFNNLKNNMLSLKQRLIIPVQKILRKDYTVKAGDTLNSIANKFNITLKQLKNLNNLKQNIIYANQKLIINQ